MSDTRPASDRSIAPTLRAHIESKLVDPETPSSLTLVGAADDVFLDVAVRAHRALDPSLGSDDVPRQLPYESQFSLGYIWREGDPWAFPGQIRLPEETTFGTVHGFFGADLDADPPLLTLDRSGGRGGDGFYPAVIVVDTIRAAAEIYGIYVGGRELARFAARRHQKVPFAAIKRWTRTGRPDAELIKWVQRFGQVSPDELAMLLNVDESRCPDLLTTAGYRRLTGSGDFWYRPREEPDEDVPTPGEVEDGH